MQRLTKTGCLAAIAGTLAALPAWAQDATGPIKAPTVDQMAGMVDKGDTTWMLVSSALVLLMAIPALGLFYGGLVRTKNMLSVLMQVFMIVAIVAILWVAFGYSLVFTGGGAFFGGLSKAFLSGVNAGTFAATFSNNVYIPEYAFVIFQMTFACITPGLIVGAFAERVRFWPLMLFSVLWVTLVYFPVAHMVWYWGGPDFLPDNPADAGYLWGMGALDFAGGTVVHINAGIAGLMGCVVIGKRIGHGRENMAPHSLTMTMIGASMLWVGWFGFNVGSNLEANGGATLAMINTFVATAAATLAWSVLEALGRGKASMLGAASGMVAGLVAVTPACGTIGPMGAILLGGIAAVACYFFVTQVKNMFRYDDSLDVFGVHGVGGIVGALLTGVFSSASLGGIKGDGYSIGAQVWVQLQAVMITAVWTAVVSFLLFKLIDMTIGLRVDADSERQGLDQTAHGESAYHG